MQKNTEVEKIIEYLQGKIESIKQKLKAYESPMMQDMAKSSIHLQMDYIRLSTELQVNEDNLLAIQKFVQSPPVKNEKNKPSTKSNAKDGKNKE
jgi:hypothetical protein